MYTSANMIKCFSFLFLFFTANVVFSQSKTKEYKYGYFKTYEDYANNNIQETENRISVSHSSGKFKIKFTDLNGKALIFKKENINFWGYNIGDGIHRIDHTNHQPYRLIEIGEICVYASHDLPLFSQRIDLAGSDFFPKISDGINGEMMHFSKSNLLKLLKGKDHWIEKVSKCRNDINLLAEIIIMINDSTPSKVDKT